MTRLDARTFIRKALGETTAAFWSDEELNTWINLAGHDIAEKTNCIHSKGFFSTSAGVDSYDMDSLFTGFLTPLDVYMYQDGETWQKIDRRTRKEMDMEIPGWKSSDPGTPYLYQFETERGKVVTLYPSPNSLNSGANYGEIYYSIDFTDVSSDSTNLSSQLPQTILEMALIDWVVATGFESRGMTDKANDRWQKYGGRIQGYRLNMLNQMEEDQEIVMRNYRNR